jgi:hypothetical protein
VKSEKHKAFEQEEKEKRQAAKEAKLEALKNKEQEK